MDPFKGSESILIYDSCILLGSVAVTSGEKVNFGPKDAPLFLPSTVYLSLLYSSTCAGNTTDSLRAEMCVCRGAAKPGTRTACPTERSRLWTEGYRCVAEEETTECIVTQTAVGLDGMTLGLL